MRRKWCIKGTRRLKVTPHFNNNQKGVTGEIRSPARSNRARNRPVRHGGRSTGRQPGSKGGASSSGLRPVNRALDRRVRCSVRSTGRQPGANRPPTGGAPGPAKGVRSLARSDRPLRRAVRSVARSDRVRRGKAEVASGNGHISKNTINSPSPTSRQLGTTLQTVLELSLSYSIARNTKSLRSPSSSTQTQIPPGNH